MKISAKGICPYCFEPVWPEEEAVKDGSKTYHRECWVRKVKIRESVQEMRQEAMQQKKCHVCGNLECPYPADDDYARVLATKWGGDPTNKECWMDIDGDKK